MHRPTKPDWIRVRPAPPSYQFGSPFLLDWVAGADDEPPALSARWGWQRMGGGWRKVDTDGARFRAPGK